MDSLFEHLGRNVGKAVRKGRWVLQALGGSNEDAIEAEGLVGHDLAAELAAQYELERNPETRAWLITIGNQLLERLKNRKRRFSFHILIAPETNAFALPGGYIFVTTGLLELCSQNQDEVAFVLAHEIAHVSRRHTVERLLTNSVLHAACGTLSIRNALGSWIRQVGTKFLTSAYSRENESEADEFAVRLTTAAGFPPGAAERLLQRLWQQQKQAEPNALGEYFGSHPPLPERIRHLHELTNPSQ